MGYESTDSASIWVCTGNSIIVFTKTHLMLRVQEGKFFLYFLQFSNKVRPQDNAMVYDTKNIAEIHPITFHIHLFGGCRPKFEERASRRNKLFPLSCPSPFYLEEKLSQNQKWIRHLLASQSLLLASAFAENFRDRGGLESFRID